MEVGEEVKFVINSSPSFYERKIAGADRSVSIPAVITAVNADGTYELDLVVENGTAKVSKAAACHVLELYKTEEIGG